MLSGSGFSETIWNVSAGEATAGAMRRISVASIKRLDDASARSIQFLFHRIYNIGEGKRGWNIDSWKAILESARKRAEGAK